MKTVFAILFASILTAACSDTQQVGLGGGNGLTGSDSGSKGKAAKKKAKLKGSDMNGHADAGDGGDESEAPGGTATGGVDADGGKADCKPLIPGGCLDGDDEIIGDDGAGDGDGVSTDPVKPPVVVQPSLRAIYRTFATSPEAGTQHFYTYLQPGQSLSQDNSVTQYGFTAEGRIFYAFTDAVKNAVPLYRCLMDLGIDLPKGLRHGVVFLSLSNNCENVSHSHKDILGHLLPPTMESSKVPGVVPVIRMWNKRYDYLSNGAFETTGPEYVGNAQGAMGNIIMGYAPGSEGFTYTQ